MKIKAERITDTYVFFWGGPFSQWYRSTFKDNETGIEFNCAEQYMMAHKASMFGDTESLKKIMAAKNPREQKALGRRVKNFDHNIWDEDGFGIVVDANLAKFSQNAKLKEMLLATGDKVLVEASPYDKIWGIGLHWNDDRVLDESKWQGDNLLGQALMMVRNTLE